MLAKGIKIYYLDISQIDKGKYSFLRSIVSEQRKQKADTYRFIEDSYRCICSAVLVKYALMVNGVCCNNIEFLYNDYGKPYLNYLSNVFFNLSHSGNRVVVALSSLNVGVDVEQIQSGLDDAVRSLYTENEFYYINSAQGKDHDERLIQIWTMKESYSKFRGCGLSLGLEKYNVNPNSGTVEDQNGIVQSVQISNFLLRDGYCLSVCGLESVNMVAFLNIDDLIGAMQE